MYFSDKNKRRCGALTSLQHPWEPPQNHSSLLATLDIPKWLMPYGIWGAGDTSQTPYVKMKSDETLFPTANCCSEALVCSRLWTLRALAFPSFFCGDLQLQEGVPVTAWAPALTKEGKWTDPQLPASSGSDPLPPPAPAQFSAPGFCIFNSGQNVISLKLLALSCCYLNYKSAPSPCHSRVIFSFW